MTSPHPSCKIRDWWRVSGTSELIGVILILIVACVAGRLLLDQPNFKPSMAAAILAGAILGNWRLAILVPLVSGLATDLILGTYELALMAAVYGCLALPVFWYRWVRSFSERYIRGRSNSTVAKVVTVGCELVALNIGAVLSAIVFYLVTSLVVWCATPWYPTGIEGLSQAYWNAIPFMRWMIQGNLLFLNLLALTWLGYRAASEWAWSVDHDAQPVLPQ